MKMEKKDILVVEDNEMNQFLIQTIFENEGYTIGIAENGLEAVELLKVQSFDVILMDLMMPVMNGYEATTIIRKELQLKTPIIAVTADVTSNVRERCIECGMNDYISKPYNGDELIETVKKYLK
jgi:CheY-like chemotaxis protein